MWVFKIHGNYDAKKMHADKYHQNSNMSSGRYLLDKKWILFKEEEYAVKRWAAYNENLRMPDSFVYEFAFLYNGAMHRHIVDEKTAEIIIGGCLQEFLHGEALACLQNFFLHYESVCRSRKQIELYHISGIKDETIEMEIAARSEQDAINASRMFFRGCQSIEVNYPPPLRASSGT